MDASLEKYLLSHIDPEESILEELDRYTNLNVLRPRMLSGHLQGAILKMLCRLVNPRLAVEIGTYTGYSAICLARGLAPGGHLHTIEINDELEPVITDFLMQAGVTNQVTLHIGDAIEILPSLPGNFDLAYIDGDKRQYPNYYEMIFEKIVPGGYIIADNTLWGGKVYQQGMPDDDYTEGVMKFNDMVRDDSRVEKVILPIRDGLTLIRKKA